MLALLLAAVPALAEDDPARPLVLLPDYLTVVAQPLPTYATDVDPASVARPCTVLVELQAGQVARIRGDGCNEVIRQPLEDAIAEWQFNSKTTDAADGLLALHVEHLAKRKGGFEATITPVWAVSPQNRVAPAYPEQLPKGDPKTADCRVEIKVDAYGKQDGLQISECPDAYAAKVTDALGKWQWYPLVVDKKPTGFRTVVRIQFVRK